MIRMSMQAIGTLFLGSLLMACTQTGDLQSAFSSSKSVGPILRNSESSSSGGNGEYYGGKPEAGIYVRRLPGMNCGPQNPNQGEILVKPDSIVGKFVNPVDCSVTKLDMTQSTFEVANYLRGQIGFIEGIYSATSAPSVVRPDSKMHETWCRKPGSSSRAGFDVVIRADYRAKIYEALVVSVSRDAQGREVRTEHAALGMRRDVELSEKVRYRANGFELDIRTKTFNPGLGTMSGDFDYNINGFTVSTSLECRLGGELDVLVESRPYDLSQLMDPRKAMIAFARFLMSRASSFVG